MNAGSIVPLCLAMPLVVCLVIRELRWRERIRNWQCSEGSISGFEDDPDRYSCCPIVTYDYEGQEREQVCEFNLYAGRLGATVPILIDPESGRIFVARFRDRWVLSGLIAVCVLLLGGLSYLSN